MLKIQYALIKRQYIYVYISIIITNDKNTYTKTWSGNVTYYTYGVGHWILTIYDLISKIRAFEIRKVSNTECFVYKKVWWLVNN